jgi:hypothetical protein
MDDVEKYEFDRQGYLVLPGLLSPAEVQSLTDAVDRLEQHALARLDEPPRKVSYNLEYHYDDSLGYHASDFGSGLKNGSPGHGTTLVVEDFFNADPAFDMLVNHEPTMAAVRDIVQGSIRINNSELRIRYTGNCTEAHSGGPVSHKYRYGFLNGIDAMMVRMIYFLHGVDREGGAFSVVPGTHKSNYSSPYEASVDEEPGMIPVEVAAGDGVLFTEALRHGGFTNGPTRTRKTLHVGYGPAWMMSQNIATMDEPQFIQEGTLARYDDAQRALFLLPTDHF